jgi:hypothetical protein
LNNHQIGGKASQHLPAEVRRDGPKTEPFILRFCQGLAKRSLNHQEWSSDAESQTTQ